MAVEETHVGRPLRDPAAQMAIMQRLRSLGLSVIVPNAPVADWKESLLQTGQYGDEKVDFLLEGEGTSAFAAQLHGLTSCRARVELRLVPGAGPHDRHQRPRRGGGRGSGRGPGGQDGPGRSRRASRRRGDSPRRPRNEGEMTWNQPRQLNKKLSLTTSWRERPT